MRGALTDAGLQAMPSLADERRRLKDEEAKKAREARKQPPGDAALEQEARNGTCQANSRAAKLEADEIRLRLKELDGISRNKPKPSVSGGDGVGGRVCEDDGGGDDVAAPRVVERSSEKEDQQTTSGDLSHSASSVRALVCANACAR